MKVTGASFPYLLWSNEQVVGQVLKFLPNFKWSLMTIGELQYVCPECERKLAPVGAMEAAGYVIYRTCSGCKARWQIAVKPMMGGKVHIDEDTFIRLPRSAYD